MNQQNLKRNIEISGLNDAVTLNLDQPQLNVLEESGIKTLNDLLNNPQKLKALEIDDIKLATLNAHAELNLVSPNLQINQHLINQGVASINSLANTPITQLQQSLSGLAEPEQITQLHQTAQTQTQLLNNILTGKLLSGEIDVVSSDAGDAEVAEPCECTACNSATNPRAYLIDLIQYLLKHVFVSSRSYEGFIRLSDIDQWFLQNISELPTDCKALESPIQKIRIVVEVLRSYYAQLDQANKLPDKSKQVFTAQERRYLEQAYSTLLSQLGTSLTELRLLQTASDDNKKAVAQRLGIHVQNLDDLILDPATLTEDDLNLKFGLKITTHSQTQPNILFPSGILSIWRSDYLREVWKKQDDERKLPIIDPDLVDFSSLKFDNPNNSAYQILQQRRQWLEQVETKLAKTDTLEKLNQETRRLLGISLDDYANKPEEEQEKLSSKFPIAFDALQVLLRIRLLLKAQPTILQSEWLEVIEILVQLEKQAQFKDWISQEQAQDILLSPDWFVYQKVNLSANKSPRRLNLSDARDWEQKLKLRQEQASNIIKTWQDALAKVEEETLPILRDALINAVVDGEGIEEKTNKLSDRFLIDVGTPGGQYTTRTAQAIETLQTFAFAIRTNQFVEQLQKIVNGGSTIYFDTDNFESDWRWIGTYEAWKAVTLVFLYPENLLLPSLRRHQTPVFNMLVKKLRNSRQLSLETTQVIADEYTQHLQDISTLTIKACCNVSRSLSSSEPEVDIHLFATAGATNKTYWSKFDPQKLSGGYAQGFWQEMPDILPNSEILGAISYQNNSNQHHLYLFYLTPDKLLKFKKYDVQKDVWDSSIYSSPKLPNNISQAFVWHMYSETTAPFIALYDDEDGGYGLWQMDQEGIIRYTRGLIGKEDQNAQVFIYDRELKDSFAYVLSYAENTANWLYLSMITGESSIKVKDLPKELIKGIFVWNSDNGTTDNYVDIILGDKCHTIKNENYEVTEVTNYVKDIRRIVFSTGGENLDIKQRYFAYQTTDGSCYISQFERNNENIPVPKSPIRISPKLRYLGIYPYRATHVDNFSKSRDNIESNPDSSLSILTYIEELYFYLPLQIALEFQKKHEFEAALAWYRSIYNFSTREHRYFPLYEENIRLSSEERTSQYQRTADWLSDPFNTHAIASLRPRARARYLLISLVKCFLAYADSEFSTETKDSIGRARQLYLSAIELLDQTPELKQNLNPCDQLIIQFINTINADFGQKEQLVQSLYKIPDRRKLEDVLKSIKNKVQGDDLEAVRLEIKNVLGQDNQTSESIGGHLAKQAELIEKQHHTLLSDSQILTSIYQLGNSFNSPFADLGTLNLWTPSIPLLFCISPNPVINSLRIQAKLNLYKLRTGLNLAGVERALHSFSLLDNSSGGLPIINDDIIDPAIQPINAPSTSYRYEYLFQRAKELGDRAAQIEGVFLNTLEKYDSKTYSLLKARQDLELAQSNVQLKVLNIQESVQNIALAELQRNRSTMQVRYYRDLWVETSWKQGVSKYEQEALDEMQKAMDLTSSAAALAGASGILSGLSSAIGGLVGSIVNPTALVTGIFTGVGQGLSGASQHASLMASVASQRASMLSMRASHERRRQEWLFLENLHKQNVVIGDQQIALANTRSEIVSQEHEISQQQFSHTSDTVDFLANRQFTTPELYYWMSDVLEKIYSYFLQEATAIAKLAERQLMFELQQTSLSFIRSDYWKLSQENSLFENDSSRLDRRGLTGSAQLTADLYRLEKYRVDNNQRKLQLTKVISLSRLSPIAFSQFRDTGNLRFTTQMELFDEDFPGHYLRLIKRVRVSVIALIPPLDGIRAELSTLGISRVVVNQSSRFTTQTIRRQPELIALSSPINSTGLFELSPENPEMLLPFEGIGVDTSWEFNLPKSSNFFDYGTIADVLLTIDYTAMFDSNYKQQILAQLEPERTFERAFSFRNEFADAWYDLHHPEDEDSPIVVTFETDRSSFLPNLENLKIDHLILYFAGIGSASIEATLKFTPAGENLQLDGGLAPAIDGIISTRRSAISTWGSKMIGQSPVGKWEVTLSSSSEIKKLFSDELVTDILFVTVCSGQRRLE